MYCQYEECIIECWVDITFMKIIVIKINCSVISFKIININTGHVTMATNFWSHA